MIKELVSGIMVGVGFWSPIAGQANENISNKKLDNSLGNVDTTKGVETSDTLSKEYRQLIDLRFRNFLNGEGGYSDEELEKRMFYFYNPTSKADLGFCGVNGIETVTQGVLLGHFFQNDKDYLAVGIKDKDKKNIITLVEFAVNETLKAYSDVAVIEMVGGSSSTSHTVKSLTSREEVDSFIDEKMGDVVLFNYFDITDQDLKSSGFKALDEVKTKFYLETVVPRIDGNTEFIAGLLMPTKDDLKGMRPDDVRYIQNLSKSGHIESVSSCSDVKSLLNNKAESLPLLSYIAYNVFIH